MLPFFSKLQNILRHLGRPAAEPRARMWASQGTQDCLRGRGQVCAVSTRRLGQVGLRRCILQSRAPLGDAGQP